MTPRITLLSLLVILLFLLNLFFGSVHISPADVLHALTHAADTADSISYIVRESRVPCALTATLAGAGLATSGLLLQTAFRNPLAGPSVLGISSGASLGVALVMLASGGGAAAGLWSLGGSWGGLWGSAAVVVGAAFVGSLAVMGLLLVFSSLLKDNLLLLITGVMMGYVTSSVISLLGFFASADRVQGYVVWGMGSFGGVSMQQMPVFASVCVAGLCLALMLAKPLNALALGERYAANLGVNLRGTRNVLLLATGLLTAVCTAYCGPVSFIGLATPHIAFLLLGTSDHRLLLPATMLAGAATALLCSLLCSLPSGSVIPLNAVTPVVGAPVVLYVILRRR